MPFEVFIFVWETSERLTLRHSRRASLPPPAHSRNRPENPALPNRESAIDFARYLHDYLCGAGDNLSRAKSTSHASKSSSSRALSSNILHFDIYVVIFHPPDAATKKLILSNCIAVGCTLQRTGSYITFNIPVPARTKIFPAAHCSCAHTLRSHFNHPRRKQPRDKNPPLAD